MRQRHVDAEAPQHVNTDCWLVNISTISITVIVIAAATTTTITFTITTTIAKMPLPLGLKRAWALLGRYAQGLPFYPPMSVNQKLGAPLSKANTVVDQTAAPMSCAGNLSAASVLQSMKSFVARHLR